jgi:ferredoxin-NAD(P)+ reductase (naphthalene dioxygenase ferredoxin-specific)
MAAAGGPAGDERPAIVYRGQRVPAVAGRDVLSLLLDHDLPIQYLCMAGSCGTCRVQVCAGGGHLEPMGDAERAMLPDSDGGDRLACQAIVIGDGDVVIAQA